MECPHCHEPLQMTKTAMKQELMAMRISWEGALVEASTVGGLIENTRKLLASGARDVGFPSDIFMHSIEWGDKTATFNFLVVPK